MKLKRIAAFAVAFVMMVPAGVLFESDDWMGSPLTAQALANSNLAPEAFSAGFQLAGAHDVTGLATRHDPVTGIAFPQQDDSQRDSAAHAAINVLDVASRRMNAGTTTRHDRGHMTSNIGGIPSNRARIAAYLTRGGAQGGPLIAGAVSDNIRRRITGISYIPDLAGSPTAAQRTTNRNLIKRAVAENGAVGISVFMDDRNRIQEFETGHSHAGYKYYDHAAAPAPNHTIALIGWDDEIVLPAFSFSPSNDSERTITGTETTGAFLAYDSIHGEYWISYRTIDRARRAYFIDGFIPDATADLIGHTYEFDTQELSDVLHFNNANTAWFANVFTVNSASEALRAVSIFLTGEHNQYSIYFLDEFNEVADLTEAVATEDARNANRVASGTRALPGYYTIPLNGASIRHLPPRGERFAIIARVTQTAGRGPIPVQSVASAMTGRSFAASGNASGPSGTWQDFGAAPRREAIMLKAHVETGLDRGADGVRLPTTPGVTRTHNGTEYQVLEVNPRQSYDIGPMAIPINATNVMPDTNSIRRVEWRMSDRNLTDMRDIIWLDSNSAMQNLWFLRGAVGHPAYAVDPSITIDEDNPPPPPPLTLDFRNSTTTGQFRMSVANHESFLDDDENFVGDEFFLSVTIHTGTRDDDGNWTPSDPAESLTTTIIVRVVENPVSGLTLSVTTPQTMRAGATRTVRANITPSDATLQTVRWRAIRNYTSHNDETFVITGIQEFDRGFDAADPFHPQGPPIRVEDDGRITALRDGTAYVFAEVGPEGAPTVQSRPLRVTVTRVAATGVAVPRRRQTMSTGTTMTLAANIRPAGASSRRITWASQNTDVVTVREPNNLGIVDARAPGTAILVATTADGNFTAEVEVTVTNRPTAVHRMGRSVNLTMLGTGARDEVEWSVDDGSGNAGDDPLENAFFTATQNNHRLRVTADAVGRVIITATVTGESFRETGNGTTHETVTIREQSWIFEAVNPLARMQVVQFDPDNPGAVINPDAVPAVRRATLSIDVPVRSPSRNESIYLQALIVRPDNATMLDFEWTSRREDVATVEVLRGTDNCARGSQVRITAHGRGSTRITALNFNGNRRININVRVFDFPTELESRTLVRGLGVSADAPLIVPVNRTRNLASRVTAPNRGRNVSREVRYTLYQRTNGTETPIAWTDANGNVITASGVTAIATLNNRGRVSVTGVGNLVLEARGSPFDSTAPRNRTYIAGVVPVRRVVASGPAAATVGETITITASVDPENATNQGLTAAIVGGQGTLTRTGPNTWTLTPTSASGIRVMFASEENERRRRVHRVRVAAAPAG